MGHTDLVNDLTKRKIFMVITSLAQDRAPISDAGEAQSNLVHPLGSALGLGGCPFMCPLLFTN